MGGKGRGRGGLAPEEEVATGFKTERGKVHTGKGVITGSFLIDGPQVPGDVSADLVDLIPATERDASDLINRDRIPRQYQKAVKGYFANVRQGLKDTDEDDPAAKPDSEPDQPTTTPTGEEQGE